MAIRLNDASVVTSFQETIPRAAQLAEVYLRLVARGVQECEPPVSLSLDELVSGTFRSSQLQCLVVTPTEPSLRHYKTAHFARPSGGLLNVGWYLVGGERQNGIGFLGIGAISELGVDTVMSIVETVQIYAVIPAIEQIAGRIHPSGGSAGFVGA